VAQRSRRTLYGHRGRKSGRHRLAASTARWAAQCRRREVGIPDECAPGEKRAEL